MKTEEIDRYEESTVLPFLALKSSEIIAEVSGLEIPQIIVDDTSSSIQSDNISKKEVVIQDDKVCISEESLHQTTRLQVKGSRLSLKSTVSSFFLRQFDKVKDQEYLTILLSLMSGILQTMYGTVYNTIETDIDKSTVLWIRGFLQVATMMCIGHGMGLKLTPQLIVDVNENESRNVRRQSGFFRLNWFTKAVLIMTLTALIGGIRLSFIFLAYEKSPLGAVQAIMQGSPIVVMFLSHFFLHDKLTLVRGFCGVGLISGILLIMDWDGENLVANIGFIFASVAMILSASGQVLTKMVSKSFEKVAIAFYLGFAIFFVGVLMSFAFEGTAPKLPQKPLPWIGAIFVACLGILQQFCLIAALKSGSPVQVAMVRSFQIVLSFIMQIPLKQDLQFTDISGAALILFTVGIMLFEKTIRDKCCR